MFDLKATLNQLLNGDTADIPVVGHPGQRDHVPRRRLPSYPLIRSRRGFNTFRS